MIVIISLVEQADHGAKNKNGSPGGIKRPHVFNVFPDK